VASLQDLEGTYFHLKFEITKDLHVTQGMEALINQAFLHVDVIGQHVHEGHYDLVGPDGEIILPQVYESMVKPDWAITMHMWPMPEPPKGHGHGPPGPPPPMPGPPEIIGRHSKKEKGSKKNKHAIPPPPMAPPGAFMGGPGLPPPPPMPPPPPGMEGYPPPPPGVHGVMAEMGPPSALPADKKKKKKSHPTGFLMWTAGGPSRNQSLKSGKKPESNSSTAATERATSTTKGGRGATKAERPSAPNGRPMPRPSAPNGKPEGATAKAGEEQCVIM
jgi:hypothetical protein